MQNTLELEVNYPWVYRNFIEHGYHTVRRCDKYWAGLWSELIIEQVLYESVKKSRRTNRARCYRIRLLWVRSMHRCADIHNGMCNWTGLQHRSSEQHVEMGVTRRKRDNDDVRKIHTWFNKYNPFDSNNSLRSLSSGLMATENDNINCDDAKSVGKNIHAGLDNVCVENAKIRWKDQLKTLEYLHLGVKIDSMNVRPHRPVNLIYTIDCNTSTWNRLCRKFWLRTHAEPSSLFKKGIMRKPQKAVLQNLLFDETEPCDDFITNWCVVDGGTFLHIVKWPTDSTFGEIVQMYVNYLTIKYGKF